jgi:NAD(P)-dependent dehydrogenase (short-subunit alcohol dehydrogenase family)
MLNGNFIIITGGAGFLGREFCFAVARSGATVAVADINIQSAEIVAKEICATYPGQAFAIELDVTKIDSVRALIQQGIERYGRIDAVVNNAYPRNSRYGCKLEEVTYSDFCENVNLHLGGFFLVAQQFGLQFRKQGGGSIVNIASIYGSMTPRFEIYNGTYMTMPVEYSIIKAGVLQLTRYFAQYFKIDNVRVNSLSPGGVLKDQPSLFVSNYRAFCGSKGMLEPSDIAGTLIYLLSEGARHVTGQDIVVDDGFSL